MKHINAKQQNAIVGGIFGLLLNVAAAAAGVNTNDQFSKAGAGLAANTHSVEFEQEANYVGLYFIKNAGYDIVHALTFGAEWLLVTRKPLLLKHRTQLGRSVL